MQLASLFDSLSKTQIIYFSTICKTKTIIIFDIRRYQKKTQQTKSDLHVTRLKMP